jgi:hypothetical protein
MGRALGLVSLLCSLVIVAALFALSTRESGPTSETARRAEAQAKAAAASLNFTQAATQLELFRAENATYSGAVLPASFGVTLVRADDSSYCLQGGAGASVQHFTGPGGAPASGPC